MSNYTFDSDSLKYFLNKLKELFTLNSEADLKVDQVNGKDLVTNDYTDEYAQLNNKIINDIAISDKTDTEVTLTFSRKNGDSSSIRIPYDKYKKSALFVDTPEKFLCLANEENKINYRYISSLKDGTHTLVVEILKSTGDSTSYQQLYAYDEIPDYYLYVPDEEDIALRMYFIDSENTMTGITYLEPEAAYLIAEYVLNEINDNAYPNCNDGSFTNFTANDIQNDDNTFTRTVLTGKEGPTKVDFRNVVGLTKINKIGSTVTNMTNAFSGCSNLTGSPVCGPNVTNMFGTYSDCRNLTGDPVCGDKVTDMCGTYLGCINLTGSPVCGPNVIDMSGAYFDCTNLTGNPACGPNVTDMYATYWECHNLTGSPVCGNNIIGMYGAYYNCPNLSSNGYFYSNKITNAYYCFGGRNTNTRLNLYVPTNSTTLTTCLCNDSLNSLTGTDITWSDSVATNGYYFNTTSNIYIYPVANVEQAYKENELLLAKYTMNSGTNVVPEVDSTTMITMEDTTNDDSTITRSVYLDESQKGKLLSSISFNGETGLLTVEKLKIDNISDASYMFNGCSNLTSVRAMDWDTSKITKADYMFAGCSKLTKESFTNFELPNVESASHIFDGCTNLF